MARARDHKVPSLAGRDDELVVRREMKIITPVFGGGVENGPEKATHLKPGDPITPVRSAALRGQLRFWWRQVCGRGLAPEVLRQREALIWGAARKNGDDTTGKGWVSGTVDTQGLGQAREFTVYRVSDKGFPVAVDKSLAYGAFPLQPAQEATDKRPGVLRTYSGTFTVELRAQSRDDALQRSVASIWECGRDAAMQTAWSEVLRAFDAWCCFGGVGGRTRRGFGAVEALEAITSWTRFESLSVSQRSSAFDDALAAQKAALAALSAFRQGTNLGRNPPSAGSPSPAGRSRWPEPDAIRLIAGTHHPDHAPKEGAIIAFPRAAFGLPIVFKFKDDKPKGGMKPDPKKATLQPRGGARLPSPLILRPLRISNGKYVAAAVLLGPPPVAVLESLELTGLQGTHSGVATPQIMAATKPLRDHRDPNHQNSVLHAFLTYFKS